MAVRSEDLVILKSVNRELIRHNIDHSLLQIHVNAGLVQIQGIIKTNNKNIEEDLLKIKRILMWNSKIKDVIIEVVVK